MSVHRSGQMNRNLERYQRALPGALTAAGMVVLMRIQRIFIIFRPRGIATGATVRSLTVSHPVTQGSYMRVRIGPTTDYACYLEFGRGPGRPPPFQSIYDWVVEKHIAGTYQVTVGRRGPRYGRTGGKSQREAEDVAAAWAIVWKIAREGTQPFPAVRVGFRQAKSEALRVFRQAMIQGLARG